jgi:ABC-type transport system involved in cytochrome bd biosynthesis fused ATPase/permease subunit
MAAMLAILIGSTVFAEDSDERGQLLKVREAVWRDWFASDVQALRDLVLPGDRCHQLRRA